MQGKVRDDLVTVDDPAAAISSHNAITVAVEGEPDVAARSSKRLDQHLGVCGAATVIDVCATGFAGDGLDRRPQSFEYQGRRPVCSAIGAIQKNAEAVE